MRSLWIVLAFVTEYLVTFSVEASCPNLFVHHNASCYLFVNRGMSWQRAQQHCHSLGAHLATVTTSEENAFLVGYLKQQQAIFFGYDLWLGASDSLLDKTWRWVADDNSLVTYSDWSPGQPDGSYQGLERCLEYEAQYDLHWNDDECEDHDFFICERPFNPPTPPLLPHVG
ncbi:perlucin-like [Gigantopelta aegis]|uniref:perlucin-like n=1 Tax=Gigantopelta aegis TaxID=1735272 RepID=UPI001B8874EB|nr:perlucin-like [Gigantopelta aegis]